MSVTGPYYTYSQLEQLWIQNGGDPAKAPIAAAIALAESGGGAGALNPTDNNGTQTSWGLWQISNGTHSQPRPNILDPNVNAAAAVAKYHGAGNTFKPWGTFNSGAFQRYLQSGVAPVSAGVPAGASATLTSASTPAPGSASSTCLVGWNGFSILGNNLPAFCLLTKTETRALIGGIILGVASLVGVAGLLALIKGTVQVPSIPLPLPAPKPAPQEKEKDKGEEKEDGEEKKTTKKTEPTAGDKDRGQDIT
jgi:hypothetical protein